MPKSTPVSSSIIEEQEQLTEVFDQFNDENAPTSVRFDQNTSLSNEYNVSDTQVSADIGVDLGAELGIELGPDLNLNVGLIIKIYCIFGTSSGVNLGSYLDFDLNLCSDYGEV